MKNQEVVYEFMNSYHPNEKIKAKHLFFQENVLYSYGFHFPLCIKFEGGFILNLNGYSNTTSRHKGLVLRELNFNSFKELQKGFNKKEVNNILLLSTEQINKLMENLKINEVNFMDVLKYLNLQKLKQGIEIK